VRRQLLFLSRTLLPRAYARGSSLLQNFVLPCADTARQKFFQNFCSTRLASLHGFTSVVPRRFNASLDIWIVSSQLSLLIATTVKAMSEKEMLLYRAVDLACDMP
jgi:hypothetical protein